MSTKTKTRSEQGTRDLTIRKVVLKGIVPILFDRYPGDNDTVLAPGQKLYFSQDDSHSLIIPSINVMSFLSAKNTDSAPKRLLDSRKYKKFTEACASFVQIARWSEDYSEDLPLTRNGEPLVFQGFGDDEIDPGTGTYIVRHVARLKDGVPNPKVRPLLPLDWELTFKLSIYPNRHIQEQQIRNMFDEGGIAVGLGTWRGRFGKFVIDTWE